MHVVIELYAHGERGSATIRSIPWADLVGPNSGLLEALYRDRTGSRPLDLGDVVRVPDVGRFIVLAHGWAWIPFGWLPPLDDAQRPLPDEDWWMPPETRVLHPGKDHVNLRAYVARPTRRPRTPAPPPLPAVRPLAAAAERLRRKLPAPPR